jgi:hypothetical protein
MEEVREIKDVRDLLPRDKHDFERVEQLKNSTIGESKKYITGAFRVVARWELAYF